MPDLLKGILELLRGQKTSSWMVSYRDHQWWKLEKGFPAAPESKPEFVALVETARKEREERKKRKEKNDEPQKVRGIREETRRDVVPFYLLGSKYKEIFIDVRAKMWRTHLDTFSLIRNSKAPPKAVILPIGTVDGALAQSTEVKIGCDEIDFVAGMLDILDRKFGILLSVQGLIGVVISVTASTFTHKLVLLFKAPPEKVLCVVGALFAAFLFSAWHGWALLKLWQLTLAGIISAFILFLVRTQLPDYLAAGLIVSLCWLWITTTLVCLRGTGRIRWGEVRSVDTVSEQTTNIDTECDNQLTNLIRALVGRTATYRAGVLLVFSTLYCLVFTGYVTGLVVPRSGCTVGQPTNVVKTLPDESYKVYFAPGDSCNTSPDAMSKIESIVEDVQNRKPRGLLVIGSADVIPMRQAFVKTMGGETNLAVSRAECVSSRIKKLLSLKGKSIPIETTTRGPLNKSVQARRLGSAPDRVAEVRFIQPSTCRVH